MSYTFLRIRNIREKKKGLGSDERVPCFYLFHKIKAFFEIRTTFYFPLTYQKFVHLTHSLISGPFSLHQYQMYPGFVLLANIRPFFFYSTPFLQACSIFPPLFSLTLWFPLLTHLSAWAQLFSQVTGGALSPAAEPNHLPDVLRKVHSQKKRKKKKT